MAATKAARKPAKKSAPKKAAPKPPSDVDLVKSSAANPAASRAGTSLTHQTEGSPLCITTHDGARATLELAKHEPLDQAALHTIRRDLDRAIQETY